jgi:hypothetical protein
MNDSIKRATEKISQDVLRNQKSKKQKATEFRKGKLTA